MDVYRQYVAKETGEPSKVKKKKKELYVLLIPSLTSFKCAKSKKALLHIVYNLLGVLCFLQVKE